VGTKTRRQLGKERLLKIYFHHWKLQNNPEYIKLWKRWEAHREKYQDHYNKDLSEILEPDLSVYADFYYLQEKFGVFGCVLPDPFKKIDWEALIDFKYVDLEVLHALGFSFPLSPVQGHSCRKFHEKNVKGNPILTLDIDLRQDKKDILEGVSMQVDAWREIRDMAHSIQRDPISKFYIYAQVWDLRKGFPKKSFSEIARKLKQPISTVKSQFKKAHELLTGRSYIREDYKKLMGSSVKKRICDECSERPFCKDPFHCPDLLLHLEEIEGKQQERLSQIFFNRDGEKKSTYDLASDRQAYRKWQEESQ